MTNGKSIMKEFSEILTKVFAVDTAVTAIWFILAAVILSIIGAVLYSLAIFPWYMVFLGLVMYLLMTFIIAWFVKKAIQHLIKET